MSIIKCIRYTRLQGTFMIESQQKCILRFGECMLISESSGWVPDCRVEYETPALVSPVIGTRQYLCYDLPLDAW